MLPLRAAGAVSRVALLKGGRSLERQVSLRSAAQVQDALERLGHDVAGIDVGPDLVDRLRGGAAPTSPSSPCTAAAARTARCRSCSSSSACRIRAPARPRASAAWTRWSPSTRCATPGIPTPDFYAFSETAFRDLGAAKALPAIEARLGFPVVVKPAGQGSALGIKFAASAGDVPGALVAAFSYDTKVVLERYVAGRDLAVSVIDGPGRAGGAPARRGDPPRGRLLRLRGPLRDRTHRFPVPRGGGRRDDGPRAGAGGRRVRLLGCYGFARVDLMLEEATGELEVLEANAIPGLTETSLLPQAAEAAGISFDELIERVLDLALARAPA